MLGVFRPDPAGLFLIIQVDSYENALSGMLAWERKLLDDFYPTFGIDISGANQALFEKKFEDIVFKNRDGRVLKNSVGETVLMYLFINDKTVIITRSTKVLEEILARLDS